MAPVPLVTASSILLDTTNSAKVLLVVENEVVIVLVKVDFIRNGMHLLFTVRNQQQSAQRYSRTRRECSFDILD